MKPIKDNIPEITEGAEGFFANPCYEEAVDMFEVLLAFCHRQKLDFNVVVDTTRNKQESHGGFYRGIIL